MMNNFNNIPKMIFDLGGTGNVAKQLRIQPSTVSNWKKKNKIPNSYKERVSSLISEKNINNQYKKHTFNSLPNLKYNKILIIISGGIASYKSIELIRIFKKMNFETNVILTKSAQKFISPLLITSLSGNKCFTDLFSEDDEENMNHIKLARENDLILIAPTTANLIGKLANGLADDLATNVILATNNKIVLAPSMNPFMWLNPATQKNIATLKERGFEFIEPDEGHMACGEEGIGRLPDIETISKYIINKLSNEMETSHNLITYNKITNLNVVVTAGPTQENIDPIRFISNGSSGKQGYAIAEEFKNSGAYVTLISGPTNLKDPNVDKIIKIKSAKQMLNAVKKNMPADIFISAAAVSDWKLIPFDLNNKEINPNKKLKKNIFNEDNLIFKVSNNPDIINIISNDKNRPKLVIGFAAETTNLIKNAKSKLKSKNLDFIVANQIDQENQVFGNDYNTVSIIERNSLEKYEKKNKIEIAKKIINKIINNYL